MSNSVNENYPFQHFVMVMGTRQEWPADPRIPILNRFLNGPTDMTIGRGQGSTGGYEIRFTGRQVDEDCGDEPNDTLANATPTGIVDEGHFACADRYLGDSQCDSPWRDVDLYAVRVDHAPARLRVAVSLCGFGTACSPGVVVLDATGAPVANPWQWDTCDVSFESPFVALPEPGTYYVAVAGPEPHRFDPQTACTLEVGVTEGSYGITISLLPGRANAIATASAGQTGAVAEPSTELYATRFDAAANQIDVLDAATLTPVRSFPAPEPRFGGSEGLAWDGHYLYYIGVGRYPLMYRLDPADGGYWIRRCSGWAPASTVTRRSCTASCTS